LYLKNIYLRGFKSFGTRNSLIFEPGISIIVGPNGSGKSNIVDAISWVLGEQSPKSLRGVSMGDVIFKSKNEELAIAEVSLVFDNTDRMLPVEFTEVKFTRRVYIKGGSEYFINSSPCRLADIQDLIAESGIGKGLYTIISQGQVNNVVLYKPVDRKHVIDEVIGVSRHKIRRDKSKTRLEAVEDDIGRINDLLHEVKRTMDPLAIEAKKSRIFFDLSQEMKNMEMSLFISTVNSLNNKWDEESTNYDKNLIELDEIDKKIQAINYQKKEYETIFYKEKDNLNKLEGKSNYFNLLCSQLSNIKSMISNQKTSVDTIIGMIKFSMKDINEVFNNKNIADIKKQSENTVNKKDIEKVIERINIIFELADKFFINMNEWALPEHEGYINGFKKQFISELNNVKKLLTSANDFKNERMNNIAAEGIIRNKINPEDRLNRLRNIMEHAQINIINLDILSKYLLNLIDLSRPKFQQNLSGKNILQTQASLN
jgi:chromosome segregation protein